jgi:uncharacterized membrane protein YfcA
MAKLTGAVLLSLLASVTAMNSTAVNGTLPTYIAPFQFNGNLAIGTLMVFIGGLLCAGGGIGGGGLYIPIFLIILNMSPHAAVPLSKCTIVGVAIGSLIVNIRRRHPVAKHRYLIDFAAACVMEPMTIVGTTIGVLMNITFPTPILIICLTVLLTGLTFSTFKKGFKYRRREQQEALEESQGLTDHAVLDENYDGVEVESGASAEEVSWNQKELQELKEADSKFPWNLVLLVIAGEVVLLTFQLLKGGTGAAPSIIGVICGTPVFWFLMFFPAPICALATVYIGYFLRARFVKQEQAGWKFEQGDVKWVFRNTVLFPAFSLFAGVAAGFLGIGGGLVKGPILLELGLLPQVVTVTSSFMIMFTASSTSTQFLILGRITFTYAFWYCGVGLCAAAVANLGVAELVRRYRKESYVTFIIGTAIGLSVIAMTSTLLASANKLSFAFHNFCTFPPVLYPGAPGYKA